ncbi:MAG: VOC family protein [Pseudomonadota bacterium]
MPQHISGIDHLVILVSDLDQAAATYQRLGFTVSPRGLHSPHMGTGNHTIMLRDDYFELLAVVSPTDINVPMRKWLGSGEGLYATALRTDDAAGMYEELTAAGVTVNEPVAFQRPVDLPGGGKTEAAFAVTSIQEPGGVRDNIFGCQHMTRDAVWLPGLMTHANTASGLQAVVGVAEDLDTAAAELAVLFGGNPVREGETVLFDANGTKVRLRAGGAGGLPLRFTGITFAVEDLDAAADALKGVPYEQADGAITVAAEHTHGVDLTFKSG